MTSKAQSQRIAAIKGMALGETNIMNLIRYPVENNHEGEIKRIAEDEEYPEQLRGELKYK